MKRIDKVCNHSDYCDRFVTINGKKYKVMRCKKCGREYKVPA